MCPRLLTHAPQVRFVRKSDPRTKKDAAYRIVQLPAGTVQFEAVEETRVSGEVRWRCVGLQPGVHGAAAWGAWVWNEVACSG